jgi:hypothetical protein
LRSSGTHLVANAETGALVSRDGLTWTNAPVEKGRLPVYDNGVLAAYDGTLLVRVPHELSTVPMDPQATAVDAGLPQLESLQLPPGGFWPDAAALGPKGVVIAACDAACVTSTVWHSADGRSWTEVYRSQGELWAEVVALPDGFVALSDRQDDLTFRVDPGGDPFVLYSADGREWSRIDAADSARYELAGTSPLGAVLEVMDLDSDADPDRHSAIVVAGADGLRQLNDPQDPRPHPASGSSDVWGAGALGVVGVLAEEHTSVMTDDGVSWHRGPLPDDVPDMPHDQWLHVTDDVALLQSFDCQDAAGLDVACGDPSAESFSPAWFRGTRLPDGTNSEATGTVESPIDDVSDEPTTTDLLPGVDLVTEEVEPGVYRVLSDGVRGPDPSELAGDPNYLVAGLDGSVVLGRGGASGYRLGDPETFPIPDTRSNEHERLVLFLLSGVGPDGTIWATRIGYPVDGLSSWDGEQWVVRDEFDRTPRRTSVLDTAVALDGTVWVVTIGEDPPARLRRLSDEGWERVRGTGKDLGWIASNASGDLVLVRVGDTIMRATTDGLEPFRDVSDAPEGIKEMPGDAALPPDPVVRRPAGVSSDGSMWWMTREAEDFRSPTGLVRLNEAGWQTFDIPDAVIEAARCNSPSVAPDGSVWIGSAAWQGCEEGSHEIHRFDGDAWTQLLPDHSGWSPVFGPHGTAWSWANRLDGTAAGLYVITPEAVTGAG